MKNQTLFSPKDKSKKLKCRLLQFLFGALRVRYEIGQVENMILMTTGVRRISLTRKLILFR